MDSSAFGLQNQLLYTFLTSIILCMMPPTSNCFSIKYRKYIFESDSRCSMSIHCITPMMWLCLEGCIPLEIAEPNKRQWIKYLSELHMDRFDIIFLFMWKTCLVLQIDQRNESSEWYDIVAYSVLSTAYIFWSYIYMLGHCFYETIIRIHVKYIYQWNADKSREKKCM